MRPVRCAVIVLVAIVAPWACGDNLLLPVAPGFPDELEIAASNSAVNSPFGLVASGSALMPLGNVAMMANVGTMVTDGSANASFVYMTQWHAGYMLYQGFAVGPHTWDIFWLYCQAQHLVLIYDEGVSGASGHSLFFREGTGSCTDTTSNTTAQVALPAFKLRSPVPHSSFDVDGDDIVIQDGAGMLTMGGRTLPLAVFEEVDCSECGRPGWYELHSIVWDQAQQRATFVIIYLIADEGSVELAYARSLPTLDDPIGNVFLTANWSSTAAHASPPPRFHLPPPSLLVR